MANEASKKDLADLEKRINTRIDNLVDSTNKAFKQETDGINKAIAEITKQLTDIRTVINQHAKAINERD